MIRIGDYWGEKYEYFRYYIPFRIRHGIKLVNWRHCMEAVKDPEMYMHPGFVPRRNDVIWDIGSQFGDYALICSEVPNTEIFAFELNKDNYYELQANLKMNRTRNVFAYGCAIGNGTIIEYKMERAMAVASDDGTEVYAHRLDDLSIKKPNIIKIDVEGFELEVLKGARKSLKENSVRLIVETHSTQLRKQVDEFLRELNYFPSHVGRTVKGKDWMDEVSNVFYTKEVKK